jgi:uncharacterized membrane protein YfcA
MLLLQKGFADSVQGIVGKLLGITYLLISLFMIWQVIRAVRQRQRRRIELETAATSEVAAVDVIRPDARKMIWLGIIAGYVVGLTSVGSGTLFMAFLVVIYPIAVARLVGTDIVQAVLVTGVAGLAHLSMGNVDLTLVGQLLIGSIPGILIGSRMTTKMPESFVKSALFVLIFCAGYKMLMK